MLTLRRGEIENLLRALDNIVLSRHSFDYSFNNSNGEIINIVFKDERSYHFKALQPNSPLNEQMVWRSIESPGRQFTTEQEFRHAEYSSIPSCLAAWTTRIIEDLAHERGEDRNVFDQLRQNVEDVANKLDDPESPFSELELAEWNARFDDLLSRLKELEADKTIKAGQIENLQRQLDQIRERGATTAKRTWVKAMGNKILDFAKAASNTATKTVIEAVVKGLLENK